MTIPRTRTKRATLSLLRVALWLVVCLLPQRAEAYPWFVRHGYRQCTPCHADPSGSGPLTVYGRMMGEAVLRTNYASGDDDSEDASAGNFLWGVELPSSVLLGGDVRGLVYRQKVEGAATRSDALLMQADLEAGLQLDKFLAIGTFGYAHEGALGAALTRGTEHNLVSRQHWLGYWLAESLLVRAGRMNLPFGIRNVEHTLWARNYTRTGINDQQQYGLSLTYQGKELRGELMGIAGNLQLRPDVFRERGASAYLEWFPLDSLGVGASGLATHRELDPRLFRETWRHAYGLTARYATPWKPLVLLSEWDYSFESPREDQHREGVVGYLQADLEFAQGVHFLTTGEAHNIGINAPDASFGVWFSYLWFFAPHADLRFDAVFQSLGTVLYRTETATLLAQLHVYL
jgi:hypothetical protein